ncbi:1,25-dihydroxyvitamin D(3) 24-hydroxylase, mitochondrial [Nematostella vectensis]|uniref:1,25-dihydroxyvitamin D(3) 24-hydroxylase, mitochondrial n=1 Tax=Nematostella vectensis TaxID=45351 RepID=UPI00138FCCE7|nr:1,25-dihydroxyvitamin D(3) 24-hydroxylase, mitochondrial [Nematostella vectensis]
MRYSAAGRPRLMSRVLRTISARVLRTQALQGSVFRYSTKAYNHDAMDIRPFQEIPGPKGLPWIGSIHGYILKGGVSKLHLLHQSYFKKYGPIYKDHLMGTTTVSISDPEDIAKVFRNEGKYPERTADLGALQKHREKTNQPPGVAYAEGQEWLRLRTAFGKKMLRPKELAKHVVGFSGVANDAMQSIKGARDGKMEVEELELQLQKYTIESIGTLVYGFRVGIYDSPPRKESKEVLDAVRIFFPNLFKQMTSFDRILTRFYEPASYKAMCESHDNFMKHSDTFLRESIERSRGSKKEADDNEVVTFVEHLASEGLSMKEINLAAIDMFVAGVDTTATTLQWLLYNIARHPEVQERLHDEITFVTDGCGSLSAKSLGRIPYTRACLKESMRFNPPAPAHLRRLKEDTVLNGFHVSKGTIVQMSVYSNAFDDKLFKNPTEFKPERWFRDTGDKINPVSFNPFGTGKRSCLGKQVAEMEIFAFVCKLMQKFKLEYNNVEQVSGVMKLIVSPDRPVKITFLDRT